MGKSYENHGSPTFRVPKTDEKRRKPRRNRGFRMRRSGHDALRLRGAHPSAVVGLEGGALDEEDAALEQ